MLVLAAAIVLFVYVDPLEVQEEEELTVSEDTTEIMVTEKEVSTVADEVAPESYTYLFETTDDPSTSNIIGYFGSGAFAWYVPEWAVQNWIVDNETYENKIVITPKVREDSSAFSDIVMRVGISTERYNAAYLHEYITEVFAKDENGNSTVDLIIKEVLLNKHQDGALQMVINTDTLIYHIQYESNGERYDMYYMDGGDKTLEITFHARADIFHKFETHVRDLVEGIGELKGLQG